MFRVTVGTEYSGEFYDETFDTPNWQTALIAAAEMAKGVEPRPCDCGSFVCTRHAPEPDSACDLGDDTERVLNQFAHAQAAAYAQGDSFSNPDSLAGLARRIRDLEERVSDHESQHYYDAEDARG